MDLQEVINIRRQCLSKVLLSWDVNRINNVIPIYLSARCLVKFCDTHCGVLLSLIFFRCIGSIGTAEINLFHKKTLTDYLCETGA